MDISYLLWLQELRESLPAAVEQFFLVVSAIATHKAIVVLPCLIFWCLDKRAGQHLVFTFSWGSLLNQFVKNTVCCYRPWIRSAAVHPSPAALEEATGYSFPSGHTQSAATLFGSLGSYYRKRWKILFVLCWTFVLLVGFSRNFLGVHTPQDVVVGLVESIVLIALMPRLLDWVDGGERRDVALAALSAIVAAAYLAYIALKPYPLHYDKAGNVLVDPLAMQVDCFKAAGAFLGAMLGWCAERHLVRFEVEPRNIKRNLLRLVVGIVVVLVFHNAPKLLLLAGVEERWFEFVANLLTIIAAAYVAPAAFSALERRLGWAPAVVGSSPARRASRSGDITVKPKHLK